MSEAPNPMEVSRVPLANLVDVSRGISYTSQELSPEGQGIPLLNLKNVNRGGGIRLDGIKFFTGRVGSDQRVAAGDLLLAITDLTQQRDIIGCPILVTDQVAEMSPGFSLDLVKLAVRDERVDSRFLYYYLQSPETRSRFRSRSNGTTVLHLPVGEVRALPVPLPARSYQERMAAVLSVLDASIDRLSATVAALDAQIGVLGQVAIACSASVTEVRLAEVATFTNGYGYKSSELVDESPTVLINLKTFHRAGGFRWDGIKYLAGNPKPAHFLETGEVLVAKTDLTQGAEVVGRVVRTPRPLGHTRFVASADVAIVRPRKHLNPPTLFALLSREGFRRHCRSSASGTTVLHLPKSALTDYVVAIPDDARQLWLSERVDAVGGHADATQSVIECLTRLRGFLLPGLVSGRLRVEVAEEMVEGV